MPASTQTFGNFQIRDEGNGSYTLTDTTTGQRSSVSPNQLSRMAADGYLGSSANAQAITAAYNLQPYVPEAGQQRDAQGNVQVWDPTTDSYRTAIGELTPQQVASMQGRSAAEQATIRAQIEAQRAAQTGPAYVPPTQTGSPPTQGGGGGTSGAVQSAPSQNLNNFIGSRPSPSNPNILEYYDKTTGQGYPNEQALFQAIYTRTGQQVTNYQQALGLLNSSGNTPGTPPGTPPNTPPGTPPPGTPPPLNTGNPQLDAIYAQLQAYLQQLQTQGRTVNPNIQLSPQDIQRFLDQATGEISPYYASQINAIKGDLTQNIQALQQQYEYQKKDQEAQFKAGLDSSRESAAGAGTVFSGARNLGEQNQAASAQRNLDSLGLSASNQIGSQLRSAESKIGSSNVRSLSIPNLEVPKASFGSSSFGTGRSISSFTPGDYTGSIEYQQRGDIRSLSDLLGQQEVRRRSLSYSG